MATPMTFCHQAALENMAYQTALVKGPAELNAKGYPGLEYYVVLGNRTDNPLEPILDLVYARDAAAAIDSVKFGYAWSRKSPKKIANWLAWPRSQIQQIGHTDRPGRTNRGGCVWLGVKGDFVNPEETPYIVRANNPVDASDYLAKQTEPSGCLGLEITKDWRKRLIA